MKLPDAITLAKYTAEKSAVLVFYLILIYNFTHHVLFYRASFTQK